uniref:protein-tyrosine-phosphatase n=1 Tax=Parastrongyloides trichosuri TaxID=131310 RepID=A0A0N4ZYK6_PARTI
MDEILTGLYISGAEIVISGNGRKKLEELSIKNIITISAMPIPDNKKVDGIQYNFIFCMDQTNQDILGDNFIDNAVNMVEKCLDEGRVLIHCEQGVSRSATLCIAYIMRKFKFSFTRAFELVKSNHPEAYPNSGFVKQLKIYENLNYKSDGSSLKNCEEYKIWCSSTGNIPKCIEFNDTLSGIREENEILKYKCRKCRNLLFNSKELMFHKIGNGSLYQIKNCDINKKEEKCEFGYFLMPLNWMSLKEISGKINCPKCNEKIGQYNWSGKECIGEWNKKCNGFITPWIYVQKGKVDEIRQINLSSLNINSSEVNYSILPKIIIS